MVYLKPASLRIYLPQYIKPFLGFAVVWLTASFICDKYSITKHANFLKMCYSVIRSNIIVLTTLLLIMYLFNRFEYSHSIVLGTVAMVTLLEFIFSSIFFIQYKHKNGYDIPDKISYKPKSADANGLCFQHIDLSASLPKLDNINESIYNNLRNKYLINKSELMSFLEQYLPLSKLKKDKSLVLDTNTFFNFDYIDPSSHYFFLNLHKVNDYRRINQYFIQINKNLQSGGYFIGCAQTIQERYQYFFSYYPQFMAFFLYSFDSLVRRVIPKLQGFKQIYFFLSKGKNRALSKAEILGRLFYCGYNIIAIKEINSKLYYIAQKVADPKEDNSPSYGPLIKLNRVGKKNKVFEVYKLRTMHPYSEYLQDYVFKIGGGTIDGDGFKNDFRITGWGKIFRKIWFDELPMLINLFRGDIKMVGVRPLSLHKLSLYEITSQELRSRFKPGLIPPFYVDLPEDLESLQESEKKYLEKYEKSPFKTDLQYFCKAWWNIVVRRVRSK